MSKKPKKITYYYRGDVERLYVRSRHRSTYRWSPGYSEQGKHGVVFPWMTRRECQEDARKQGGDAVFIR